MSFIHFYFRMAIHPLQPFQSFGSFASIDKLRLFTFKLSLRSKMLDSTPLFYQLQFITFRL
jgi:hypothetical protein